MRRNQILNEVFNSSVDSSGAVLPSNESFSDYTWADVDNAVEMQTLISDISEMENSVEDAEAAITGLESISETVSTISSENGLSKETALLLAVSINNVMAPFDAGDKPSPSLEDYNNYSMEEVSTVVNSVISKVKAAWDFIVKTMKNALKVTIKWFQNNFTAVGNMKKKAMKLLKLVKKATGAPKDEKIAVSKSDYFVNSKDPTTNLPLLDGFLTELKLNDKVLADDIKIVEQVKKYPWKSVIPIGTSWKEYQQRLLHGINLAIARGNKDVINLKENGEPYTDASMKNTYYSGDESSLPFGATMVSVISEDTIPGDDGKKVYHIPKQVFHIPVSIQAKQDGKEYALNADAIANVLKTVIINCDKIMALKSDMKSMENHVVAMQVSGGYITVDTILAFQPKMAPVLNFARKQLVTMANNIQKPFLAKVKFATQWNAAYFKFAVDSYNNLEKKA